MKRVSYGIEGQVQGVGFRPFVYNIAQEFALVGFVKNNESGVVIEVEGTQQNLDLFEISLSTKLPPLARIDTITSKIIKPIQEKSFEIIQSSQSVQSPKTALVSSDIATCKECLADIKKEGRFYNYFATNCTNCGPRYSIVKSVPYDRKNTSMDVFTMCSECKEAYENPHDRRYHAQPISCNNCGPKLSLWNAKDKTQMDAENIFETLGALIQDAKIIAIKGLGGFHIVCDATNDAVVQKLRVFKNRPAKPFALMCKNREQIESFASVNAKEKELLSSKEAPIVILKKRLETDAAYASNIAPKIDKIGCFLPYTALQHLLFEHLQNPIVATSANLANESIMIKKEEIFTKLPFVDFVVDFDREIINGLDDSLVQVIDDKVQILRLSRGYAPKVIKLAFESNKKILAVGANQKNSLAFVMDANIIISPYIGDLDSLEAFGFFERTLETFQRFYDFEPELIVHDKHPNYETTKWAKKQNKKLVEVGHHLAHIYACKAEFGLRGEYLGFSFDGTGYGENSKLWGGEVFVGDERKYSFKTIKLLGGEKAIKEPRRVALSMLFDAFSFDDVMKLDVEVLKAFHHDEIKMLYQSYKKDLNAPTSSSVGRLFDAVASFADVAQRVSYEGESGLLCESFYDSNIKKEFDFTLEDGIIDIKIVENILSKNLQKKEIISMFINTLVKIIVAIAKREKMEVILSGGVFQNKTLLELAIKALKKEKLGYYHQQQTAINDGGIALGQAYYVLEKNIF